MKNLFKGKFGTFLVILATLILAGVAIYTAIRLYQLRQQPVAPNVPSSIPQAAANVGSCSTLAFSLVTGSGTPTPTPTGTGTGTPIPTPTPTGTGTPGPTNTPTPTPAGTGTPGPTGSLNACNGSCGSNSNCASNLVCYNGYCRNPSCTSSVSCVCGTAGPTSAPPSLPQSGTDWPTVAGLGVGIFVIISSILLAL